MPTRGALRSGSWLTWDRARAALVVLAVGYAVAWGYLLSGRGSFDPRGRAVGTDFAGFYAASVAVRSGEAEQLYDLDRYARIAAPWTGGARYPWYYPPSALLLFRPLSTVPYLASFALWIGAGLAAFLAVAWRILPTRRALAGAALFPAVFVATIHGQSILLLAAAVGLALLVIDEAPLAAGLLLGAVAAVKPHLVALVPVALVAARRGRALAGAAAGLCAAAATATAVHGWGIWTAFVGSRRLAGAVLAEGAIPFFKLQSTLAAVQLAGGGADLAYALQAAVALVAAAAVWTVWRRGAPLELRAAVLVTGCTLATPYVFDYDLVLLGIALAFALRRALRDGFAPWERTTLAAGWWLPFFGRALGSRTGVGIAPAVLAALLLLLVRAASAEDPRAVAPASP